MPYRSNIPCKHSGSAALISHGQMYCEEHKQVHVNNDRAKTAERGYGGRWQALCKSCHDNKTLKEDINPVYTF